jgi:hypothetical protein
VKEFGAEEVLAMNGYTGLGVWIWFRYEGEMVVTGLARAAGFGCLALVKVI